MESGSTPTQHTATQFGNHSMNGRYWFRKTGGILKQDALGAMYFDGKGNFSATFVLNTGGDVQNLSCRGTYEILSNGTGTFAWIRDLADDTQETLHSHVVALRAERDLITEIYSSIDQPDPETGELSGRLIYRQPD